MKVVLEPISVCYSGFRVACAKVPAVKNQLDTYLLFEEGSLTTGGAIVVGSTVFGDPPRPGDPAPVVGLSTTGKLGIVGYAIDASTLGTTNRRVGVLRISLEQYTSAFRNYFDTVGSDGCQMDATLLYPCLSLVIVADYIPLPAADGGVGVVMNRVPGFLWIAEASAPYNY